MKVTTKPKGLAKIWRENQRPFKKVWREIKRPFRQAMSLFNPHEHLSSTGYLTLNFEKIEQFESDVLMSIDDGTGWQDATALKESEMTKTERLFLNGIIRKARPKKIVEYGVAAGGSAAVILNSIKDIPDAKLYSLDYSERYYVDMSKPVGWMVQERFPHLADKWECLAGGMCCQYLDKITDNGNDKIDVCCLDTVHQNPGEFLNILEVLPYMKQNGIILLHDLARHLGGYPEGAHRSTCRICFNSLHGKRIVLWDDRQHIIHSNFGGVILADDITDMYYSCFTNLSLPWMYSIGEKNYNVLLRHFQRHYAPELVAIFRKAYRFYAEKVR